MGRRLQKTVALRMGQVTLRSSCSAIALRLVDSWLKSCGICVIEPESFRAVGQFYRDFSPTTDEEVRELLARAQSELNRG